jgi:hypothetical protein
MAGSRCQRARCLQQHAASLGSSGECVYMSVYCSLFFVVKKVKNVVLCFSLLVFFSQSGNTDLGRLLLDVGADLIKPGAGGNQAVHMAAAHGHMGFLQLCVARGADLDVVNHGRHHTHAPKCEA